MHSLMPYLAPGTEAIGGKAGKMSRSLKQKDLDGFLTQLQDFMAAIPYARQQDGKTLPDHPLCGAEYAHQIH